MVIQTNKLQIVLHFYKKIVLKIKRYKIKLHINNTLAVIRDQLTWPHTHQSHTTKRVMII